MAGIEFIARGVCVKNGRVLLCRNKGKSHAYLPGGHIERRERAVDALLREIREELGLDASVTRFLGCAESTFRPAGGRWTAEINLVFEIDAPRLCADADPAAAEGHLLFFWHPLDRLDGSGLQPEPLRLLIPAWRARPGFASSGGGWRNAPATAATG